ncbi:L-threonylcarbamoyladenylate synthase [candidate division KSB1 bacterium]
MAQIIPVNPNEADTEIIDFTVKVLERGEMIIYPAETLYGFGVDSENEAAVKRLYKHKRREHTKAVPVIVSDIEMVHRYADDLSDTALRLMDYFWPGPLTLILRSKPFVLPLITGSTGTIGMRIPDSRFCQALARELGRAVTATSANYSGESGNSSIWDINDRLRKASSLILHGGRLSGAAPSTVLSVADKTPVLIREGIIMKKTIEDFLGFGITYADKS